MKLRNLLCCVLFLTLSTCLRAGIVITTTDQQTTEALIADVSSLSWDGNFQDGDLLVNYADGTVKRLAMATIQNVTFSEDATEPEPEPEGISKLDSRKGSLNNMEGAAIYDIQGRLLRQNATADDLRALPQGQYVVKNGTITIKYLKK